MKKQSPIVTILNKDVMTPAMFAEARKEHRALMDILSAASSLQYQAGKLAFTCHEKSLYASWAKLTDAIQTWARLDFPKS